VYSAGGRLSPFEVQWALWRFADRPSIIDQFFNFSPCKMSVWQQKGAAFSLGHRQEDSDGTSASRLRTGTVRGDQPQSPFFKIRH
jgi:hypothetical protein